MYCLDFHFGILFYNRIYSKIEYYFNYIDSSIFCGGWTLIDSKSNGVNITSRMASPNIDPYSSKGSYLPSFSWSSTPKLMCKSSLYSGNKNWLTFNVLSQKALSYPTNPNPNFEAENGHFSYNTLNGNTAQGEMGWVYSTVGSGRIGTIWIGNGYQPTCACAYQGTAAGLGLFSNSADCSTWVK